jgi:protein kinase A
MRPIASASPRTDPALLQQQQQQQQAAMPPPSQQGAAGTTAGTTAMQTDYPVQAQQPQQQQVPQYGYQQPVSQPQYQQYQQQPMVQQQQYQPQQPQQPQQQQQQPQQQHQPGHQQQASTSSTARVTKGKYTLTDFDILRTLGTGSFGRVHLVQSKHNHRFYAIKVLKKAQVVKMKQVEHTNDERRMLSDVKHPFLITLWGTFQDWKNLYMVMDFVEGGELFSLLRKSGVSVTCHGANLPTPKRNPG